MRLVLLLLLAATLDAAAAATQPLEQVRAQLQSHAVVRGQFVQRKQLAGFTRPLESAGSFLLWREHGVVWNTARPFASSIVITRDAVRVAQGGKPYTLQSDAAREPALRIVNEILFAVLAGDVTRLEQRFEIAAQAPGSSWTLRLTPREAAVKRAFTSIGVDGDSFVRGVQLQEANGDRTTITFDALSTATAPTADETRLLAQ
jgi:outer membrane lipoprotein-sorting protein